MRRVIILSVAALLATEARSSGKEGDWQLRLIAPEQDAESVRQKCLGDPALDPEIRRAIEQRTVVVGMCPLEAVAAAGLPRHLMVMADSERGPTKVPLTDMGTVIAGQCADPEERIIMIQLQFRNDIQFGPNITFRVRFVGGRAVLIDTKAFWSDTLSGRARSRIPDGSGPSLEMEMASLFEVPRLSSRKGTPKKN